MYIVHITNQPPTFLNVGLMHYFLSQKSKKEKLSELELYNLRSYEKTIKSNYNL